MRRRTWSRGQCRVSVAPTWKRWSLLPLTSLLQRIQQAGTVPHSQGHNGLGCKSHQGNLKVGRGRLAKAAPGSDIHSLTASPRWELLGTRCGSGRVLDPPSRQPGGGRTPGRRVSSPGAKGGIKNNQGPAREVFSLEWKEQHLTSSPLQERLRCLSLPR